MKRALMLGVCFLLISTTAHAETMFVTGVQKITFRTGPGADHKILQMIESGQKLEIIEVGEKWTNVKLPSGREGWVMNRFITPDMPDKISLRNLKQSHTNLKSQFDSLKKSFDSYSEENKKLRSNLVVSKKEARDLKKLYEELKSGSADFLQLQANYKSATKELDRVNAELKISNDKMTMHLIYWFLAGAGVLCLGMIIGFSTKRKRRHSLL